MTRILGILAMILVFAAPIQAGNLVFEADNDEEIVYVEDEPMGSSGARLSPMTALSVNATAISKPEDRRK